MTATPYSYRSYTGNGTTDTFAVPFPYLKRQHVSVKVEDVLQTDGTDYDWTSDTQIKFKAGKVPASAAAIVVERDTPESDQIVQWADASYLTETDLNESDLQWLYNIQELQDRIAEIDGTVTGEAVKEVTAVLPVKVDNTDDQKPIVSLALTVSSDDLDSLTSNGRVMSEKAADKAFKQLIGAGPFSPLKIGQLRIDDTGSVPLLFYWSGSVWVQLPTKGDQGDPGGTGGPGPAPGLQAPPATATNVPVKGDGTVGDATATVVQDGDGDLQFQFGIPVGETGAQGVQGDAATVDAGTATSLSHTAQPTVSNSGTTSDAVFNFGIPKGAPQKLVAQDAPPTKIDGEPLQSGDLWLNSTNGQLYVYYVDADSSQWVSVTKVGPQGPPSTVGVGQTTTLNPGSYAQVTNSGTPSAAIFNFEIPRGDKGDKGDPGSPGSDGADSTVPGPAGTIGVGTTTTLNPGYPATVTNVGTSNAAVFNFGIPRGEQGAQGPAGQVGPTATVDAGTATGLSHTAQPTVTNVGSAAAAVFNFGIPKGAPQRCLIRDFPPTKIDGNPVTDGDTWYSSKTGQLYVYYDDGDSSQWVSVSKSGPPGQATVSSSQPSGAGIGELWFDESISKLKVYTSSGWKFAS